MRNALLVGTNQTRLLVWGTLAEALTNIFLDYTLIYGHFGFPELGFNGAAYASIIAEGTGLFVIYAVIHLKGLHRAFGFFQEDRTPVSKDQIKLILVQSSPLILQYCISIVSWEFFYILVEHHGSRALAVSNTMRNIFGIFGVFSWAFASTTNSMVSNIIGQGRQDEVIPLIHRIIRVSITLSIILCVALNLWPEWFFSMYSQGDEFVAEAIPIVRVVSVALIMMSFSTVWLNAVTGTGNTVINLTIEFITVVIYSIYVYMVLEHFKLSVTIGWMSEWVYWISMFSMAYAYMKSGRWRNKVI
jgi:Na+-driven multidrug efflux pump